MKMKLEIYRKRSLPNGCSVVDEKAETTISGISLFEIHDEYMSFAFINTTIAPLMLRMDDTNYKYEIKMEDDENG